MKALFLAALVAVSPAFASHFQTAELEVKVVGVENMARFDGVAVFSHDLKIADSDQNVTIEVTKVLSEPGKFTANFKQGERIVLAVPKEHLKQLKNGDVFKMAYRNVGDARASRISWEIVK